MRGGARDCPGCRHGAWTRLWLIRATLLSTIMNGRMSPPIDRPDGAGSAIRTASP
jgi:hypothetical protein